MGSTGRKRRQPQRHLLGRAVVAALAVGAFSASAHAGKQFFFAWSDANADDPGVNIASAPILTDADYASVAAQLAYSKAHGFPLAVRILTPLSPNGPAVQNVFDKYPVEYIFADLEGPTQTTRAEVSQLISEAATSKLSNNAFIGNWTFNPDPGSDGTNPSFSPTPNPLPVGNYIQSGLGALSPPSSSKGPHPMANEELYPGAPDFRSPGAANNNHNVNAGGSTAPNIRSALFTLPIERLGMITDALYGRSPSLSQYNSSTYDPSFNPSGHTKSGLNIPWVTRFNNFDNAALINEPGTAANPYIFNGTVDANPADGQLPSRGDFSAQILQYRMRGADSVNLFLASVTNEFGQAYTESQQEQDLNSGWFGNTQFNPALPGGGTKPLPGAATMNSIFSGHYGFANLTSLIRLDVATTVKGKTVYSPAAPDNAEHTGVIWSGVYGEGSNNKPTLNSSSLSILLSNLSATSHIVDLGTVAGYSVYDPNSPAADKSGFNISAGQHLLLDFSLKTIGGSARWDLSSDNVVFTDNDRDGIGTPEPASLGLLGIGALALLARRRRPSA